MKFTIGQLKKSAYNKPFAFSGEVDVSELEKMNNDIREIKPVQVSGDCTIQGDQFIFTFKVTGEMILPCARTLVDVVYPFEIKTTEIFSSSSYYTEEETDTEIHPIDGEVLDLTPYIKENILLEVPFRVYSEEAKDLPDQKGNGWEVVSEEKTEKTIDPRFKKLESLFKDNDQEK
ncbi:YceD family protein [Ornithinibacillus halophilus]|uniref:YceD family protein n=1 Tax=Ornithinibacillus halophilus TaxID=930117 RepID=UPI000932BEE2|nr:YceD family protein [Ornithinibacillus halophilus]